MDKAFSDISGPYRSVSLQPIATRAQNGSLENSSGEGGSVIVP